MTRIKKLFQAVSDPGAQRFGRRVWKVLGGSTVGQLITLLAIPVLTRLYDPNDFGTLSFYQNVTGILAVIASLRLELAIPNCKNAKEASQTAMAGVHSSILFGVALVPFSILWMNYQASFSPNVTQYWYVLPLGVVALGSFAVLNAWAAYYRQYAYLGKIRVLQSVQSVAVQVGLGVVYGGGLGLVFGGVLGQAMGAGQALRRLVRRLSWTDGASSWRQIKKRQRFVYSVVPSSVIARAAVHIPMPLFVLCYGAEMAGLVFLSQRILYGPTALLGRAAALPMQQEIGSQLRRGNSVAITTITAFLFFCLGVICASPFFLFGPEIFEIVLGEGWRSSGDFARIMSPMLILQFMAAPFAQVLAVYQKYAVQFVVECMRLLLVVCAVLLPHMLNLSIGIAVLFYTVAMSIVYGTYVALALYFSSRIRL